MNIFLALIVALVLGRVQAQQAPFAPCAVCGAGQHVVNGDVVLVGIPDTNEQVRPDSKFPIRINSATQHH